MLQITHETPTSLRIQKARTSLILDHPFFGSLLFRLKGRECRSIQTMATDGVSLFYNPDFVETLNAATLAGTLAHEVMHPALHHHVRRSGRDPKRWNVACDFAINPLLVDAGLSLPEGVLTGSDSKSISLMELRPGVGSARLVVPPSINSYDATPNGKWPADLPSDRWNGSCSGLNPRGTPFVLRNGEWECLGPCAELKLGTEIRIVAEATNTPPARYSSGSAGTISHNKVTWRMWRMTLPDTISSALDRWAEAIEVTFTQQADELSLIGVPHSSSSDGPIYATGNRFIAKVKWAPDEAPATLSLRTPLGSESSSTWPTQESPMYLAFSVRDAGMTTLTANYDMIAAAMTSVDFIRVCSCILLRPGLPLARNGSLHFTHQCTTDRTGLGPSLYESFPRKISEGR